MTIQTPESQPTGSLEYDLVFRPSDRQDVGTIRAISTALELVKSNEQESLQADFDFESPEEYSGAFDEESPVKHLITPEPFDEGEIVRIANRGDEEIGETAVVRELPLWSRVDIAERFGTSLVVPVDEAEALTGVMVLAEDLAEKNPNLRIPKQMFHQALEDLSSADLKQVA